jgi:hypothetical protein
MKVSHKDLCYCWGEARQVREQYRQYSRDGNALPYSVDDLHAVCEKYLEMQIQISDLPPGIGGNIIMGVSVLWERDGVRRGDIRVRQDIPLNDQRFIRCKELFHLVLRDESYRTTRIYEHLEEVFTTFPQVDGDPGPAAISEFLAEVAAMEFLFPFEVRHTALKRPDFEDISRTYGVPRARIERYLSPQYMACLAEVITKL